MRRRSRWWFVIGSAALLFSILGTPRAGETALEVSGPGFSRTFTLADLRKLHATEGPAGAKTSTGKIITPRTYRGVALRNVVAACARFDSSMSVSVEARDGYRITLSYRQVVAGDFSVYDPSTGKQTDARAPLTAVLAYECDGAPLDPEQDGVLRLVVVSPRKDVVTDGHWSVKRVTKLSLEPVSEEWTLRLEGTLAEQVERGTFETCASPGCHGAAWKDDSGREWSGIPLWLLVGRVDDGLRHGARAFNDSLAAAGYTVDVVAGDGVTVTFDSARLGRNDQLIVACLLDGAPLPGKSFPLRLAGPGLKDEERIGGITRIVLHAPGATRAR